MKKALMGLGVLMLAQILFVGLVQAFLKSQGKDSPETLEALHAMPVLGGFFFPPPPSEPPLSADERREMRARKQLQESRAFFELPPGFTSEKLEALFQSVNDARTRYEQLTLELEQEKSEILSEAAEQAAVRESLETQGNALADQAKELQAGREEMELRANRLNAEEMKNLQVAVAIYEQMPPDAAANVLKELDVDTVAKLMSIMSPKKSGKVMHAINSAKPTMAVEIHRRIQTMTSGGRSADNSKR